MERLKSKVNQLVIEASANPKDRKLQKTHVRTFATKPIGGLPYEKGKIFGLIEIGSTHSDVPKLIDFIIEEIKNNYYYNDDIDELSINDQFEATLKKTNLAIASFLESEYIELDLEKVNIIVALSRNQDLYFATVGNVGAYLFYNLSSSTYRIINILEASRTPNSGVDPIKIFSQVISGKMRPKDSLFITTLNLLDYFSLDSLKNLVIEPDGMTRLSELIEKIHSSENFACASLELKKLATNANRPARQIEDFNYVQAASKDSINELIKTEKETENLLTPSLMPEFKKYATSFSLAFKNYVEKARKSPSTIYNTKRQPTISPIRRNSKIQPNFKPQSKSLKKIQRGIKLSKNITGYQTKKIASKIAKNDAVKNISPAVNGIWGIFKPKFAKLPSSSKTLLIVSVFLAIAFSVSLLWINIKNAKSAKIEQFNQAIAQITTKKNEAESSLIYRDESQARQLLIESKNLLENLETDSNSQEDRKQNLIEEITLRLQELQHLVDIKDPVQIVNFQNLDQQANMANITLVSGNSLYGQNLNDKAIYKADLDTRVMSTISSPENNIGDIKFGTTSGGTEFLLLNNENRPFGLNNDSLQNLNIDLDQNTNIVDGDVYNNRLYLLDPTEKQIYRYNRSGNNYVSRTNWVTDDSVDLTTATSLTVDGAIYVLNSDGTITLLQSGRKTNFANNLIDPPLQQTSKLKTLDGSNFLYFLDTPTKRLIILDKQGNLITQYTSDAFDNLKDFIVDEETKEIYVLNGSTVYGISATHLN